MCELCIVLCINAYTNTCVHRPFIHTLPGIVMTTFSTVGVKKTIYGENCYTQLIHQLKRLRRHKFKRGPEDMVKKETTRMDLDHAKCMRNFSKIFIVLK